jgi:hypothetical protein
MRLGSKILLVTGLMATVIAVGFWLARIVQTPASMTESAPEVDTKSAPAKPDAPRSVAKRKPIDPQPATGASPVEAPVAVTNLITDWEIRIDEVLGLDADPSEVGRKLVDMLPRLPVDGRVEALQHAVNLLADEDYAPMGQMLGDPKIPEDEVEILMRDVLNRPDALKLPLLLQVARTGGHVKAGEAREILEVLLGESYGDDWDKWQTGVNELLKEGPEVSGDP